MTSPSEERSTWHAISVEEALGALQSEAEGISEAEAERRLTEHGPNQIERGSGTTFTERLIRQLANMLIIVLLGAAALAAILGAWLDSAVILAVVVINTFVGLVQEGKAESALEGIRGLLAPKATVLRDGERIQCDAERLVPGDIVLLQSGDRVPADVRLISLKSLQIDEAALTGESVAVHKAAVPVEKDAELADRGCMGYSGTVVTSGAARALVVATGTRTEIGRISSMLENVEELKTPLLKKMDVFGKWLSVVIIASAVLTFLIGTLIWKNTVLEMVLASVSLIVAAIPEGLPPIMTITLALGVQRMSRRKAIIRRLPAVETLGSVTVICSDKTGTLTRNEMTVKTIRLHDAEFEVKGVGYEPEGDFLLDGDSVDPEDHPGLMQALRAGLLCNDARLYSESEHWRIDGDPTEGALLVAAAKAGLSAADERKSSPRRDLVPFESEHRYMATLHQDEDERGVIYVKGAPDRLLDMCARQMGADGTRELDRGWWEERVGEIASRGQRTLAVARREVAPDMNEIDHEDIAGELVWLGLLGIIDPPREDAIEAVGACHSAGIRVKIITGDHAGTASAIGAQMGIGADKKAITGRELDHLDEKEFVRASEERDVFARCSPEHKLRLVEAIQSLREIVAVTGDGVNDAPALKRADIGVAMGQKGSDAAKEAAEMVLADDNFASVAHAVEEGRNIYDNLRKALVFIMPTSGGQALTVFLAIALGLTLPLRPVHVLWVNMVTAVTLALSLAFEPKEDDVMSRPPRPPDTPLITRLLLWRIIFVSILLVGGTFGHFYYVFEVLEQPIETARTAALNTLVAGQAFYLFNCRKMILPTWSVSGIFGSRAVWIAIGILVALQGLFTYLPLSQTLFETTTLGADAWLRIAVFGAALYVLVEIEKTVLRARGVQTFE
ncbi:MAG: cation-transporting P-type ATPase [Phycisphaeraceae bacterium]|nr:MAG: cation-transporting P-type ATPase [Phycisphaeraceae bacterium]